MSAEARRGPGAATTSPPPRDVAHIRDWFDLIAPGDDARTEALTVTAALLREVPNRWLRRVDHQMRERSPWCRPTGANVRPGEVDAFAGAGVDRWPVLVLCAMHRDGHVREEALRLLAPGPPAVVSPYVLLRVDDWVEPVRREAWRQIRALLGGPTSPALLPALPVLGDRLMVPGREGRASPIIDDLRGFLHSEEARPRLRQMMEEGDRWGARIAASVLLAVDDPTELEPFARTSDDVVVAHTVARACLTNDRSAGLTYRHLLTSRFAPVRQEAAFWGLRNVADAELELLVMCDPSSSVRFQAQSHLRRTGRDPRTWYLDHLSRHRSTALLVGLADVATPADEPLGLEEAASNDARRRSVAAALLRRSASPRARERLIDLVGDPSPRVSKSAARALAPHGITPDGVEQLLTCASQPPDHVARNSRRVLAGLPRWQRLLAALRLSALQEPAATQGRVLLDAVLRTWRRSSTPPQPHQLDQARTLANDLGDKLGPLGELLQRELSAAT